MEYFFVVIVISIILTLLFVLSLGKTLWEQREVFSGSYPFESCTSNILHIKFFLKVDMAEWTVPSKEVSKEIGSEATTFCTR